MRLIGMLDSPYARRVAVSMDLLGLSFEHCNWSAGTDLEKILPFNPVGRVPVLVLDDGQSLIDSAVILDYLDHLVGPERGLLPPSGKSRQEALQLMAIATGAAPSRLPAR